MRTELIFFLLASSFIACGGAIDSSSESRPAADQVATGDRSRGAASSPTPGSATAVPDVRSFAVDGSIVRVIVVKAFLGAAPGCDPTNRSVEYERATRTMTWPGCTGSPGGRPNGGVETPYAAIERRLDAAEAKRVEDALRALTYETNPPCGGYDGREYFMSTYDAKGTEARYSADNINCMGYRRVRALSDLYELFTSLR
ncbi:MAG: hypothetical protein U0235_09200 [Polyangiaceae bacterium]